MLPSDANRARTRTHTHTHTHHQRLYLIVSVNVGASLFLLAGCRPLNSSECNTVYSTAHQEEVMPTFAKQALQSLKNTRWDRTTSHPHKTKTQVRQYSHAPDWASQRCCTPSMWASSECAKNIVFKLKALASHVTSQLQTLKPRTASDD